MKDLNPALRAVHDKPPMAYSLDRVVWSDRIAQRVYQVATYVVLVIFIVQ